MIEEMTSTVEDAVAETTLMDEAAAGPSPEPDARDEEIAALKDRLLRAAAETENMRRRLERDRDEGAAYAMTGFARDLLTVADNLARAIAAAPESVRTDVAVKGLAEGVASRASMRSANRSIPIVTRRCSRSKAPNTLRGQWSPNCRRATRSRIGCCAPRW
jgi:molecular chaperone GrpE (heat shock protein)